MLSHNNLSACCISHQFYKVATDNPNKIAVIQACGGLKFAKEFQLLCNENGEKETCEKFEEFVSFKRRSVNPPVYEGDECFTFSDVLYAVDNLSSRLRCILDGNDDDPNLVKVNMHQTANNCSSKDQVVLGSSDQGLEQYTQLHKTYSPRIVGIYMEPSVEYIVSVLSILRCGEAFLPLDPSWPEERILSVISSSKADLIVGYGSSVDRTCHQLDRLRWLIHKGSYPVFYMSMEDFIQKKSDSLLGWPCESERLRSFCYLMYTSGSTGKPKGVCGTEVGLLNRFLWMQRSYSFQKEEILLFKTSISFIDHLQEFFGAILANCTLVIPPSNQLKDNIFCVVNLLQEYSISRLVAVPSLIRAILPALQSMYYSTAPIFLKLLVLSGEIFDMSLWKMLVKLLPQTFVLNIYGSTEVSGDCTYFDCKWLPTMLEQDALGSVPIGIPIDNCDVVLVGENSSDEGEICVSGSCVASGYYCHPSILPLDNVELHQEIADAKNDEKEVKCYFRTGDFARKLSDGNLVYIGRKDRTVKIRGQRIALEEVECVLRGHQEVADSAVVSRCVQGDILLLEAYLLLKQKENNLEVFGSSIRCWMADKLPPAMVPARFYFVESIPISSSGKVDYNILATSAVVEAGNHVEIDETEDSDLINVIQKAFSDALSVVDKISLDDDFFEMGGNSLLAAQVSYNLGINMKDLYAFPTPLKLQKAIQHKKVSSSRELRADALVGVNSQVQEKSKLPSKKSWMPGLDSSTSLSLTSDYPVKCLKTDSALDIDPNDVNGRDMNNSTSSQVSCSYSGCNKVRHDAGCEGYSCHSVLSWEVPCDKIGFMREQWMVYMESCIDASPLVVFKEGNVYLFIGAHSHKFFCIDATSGLVLWEIKLQGRVESSAAILDDFSQVIVGCYDGNIHFLNFSNGIPCWNFQTQGEVKSQPVIDKERHLVWCGSHDHNLYALDYENRYCVYKIRCGGSIFGAPALDEVLEKLYVASTSGRVTALFVGALPFGQLWVQEFGVPIFGSLSVNPSSGNASHRSMEIWNVVIEKFEKRLASWQQQYLSLGGRVTLINSVLDSIPTYFMSLFPIPSEVQYQLDKLRRTFLWEGNSENHKYHLVEWDKVTLPKHLGGLGIKDLALHNKCMLMKWHWRFNQDDAGLWKEIIQAKYGSTSHWCSNPILTPYGTGLWKDIRRLWDEFFLNTSFQVGNGAHILFWKDKWLDSITLKDAFPRLFLITTNPDSTIAQNWEDNSWNLHLRRHLNDWEIEDMIALIGCLQNSPVLTQKNDRLKWGSNKDGSYSVKEGYLLLTSNKDLIDQWPWKLIWKINLPPKVSCFCWVALKRACLTLDNLMKRKFHLANRCYMCHCTSETINHLFLHCPVATDVWNMFLTLFGLQWVIPHTVREVFVCWSSWKVGQVIRRIWSMVPACILWCLWLERNQRCFHVICCMVDGSVVALDTEGSVVWKVCTTGPIFAGPCISRALPSQVLVCSRDGSVYSFDLEKGDLFWKHGVGHPITSSAYVDEHLLLACIDSSLSQRLVCVCSSSGSIHVLQVSLNFDGEKQPCDMVRDFARFELGGDSFSSPVMIGGKIFVGCRDDYVHCIRLQEEIPI
ncbi:putative acyl-activating enzyme 19 isoform X2 [Lycium barbarum]|uniref:putative acyl-activating enzyme 19 isoform X2 n=1 Tax=Lycium barbarum TaxID=112863 RepID=UPI00293F76B1|nr:putative acyl-activating enzyme 19 isoform X2 [Lycium barbarum]